jgi:hypothetical protein
MRRLSGNEDVGADGAAQLKSTTTMSALNWTGFSLLWGLSSLLRRRMC